MQEAIDIIYNKIQELYSICPDYDEDMDEYTKIQNDIDALYVVIGLLRAAEEGK